MLDFIHLMALRFISKFNFWRKKDILLSLCTQGCYGRHNVSQKSVNHLSV